mgnify:CR=1 FL=1
MARPIKLNADYFSHDSDMRNDPKVKALRRKFHHSGFSVWVMLLETLTDADNFEIEFTDLNMELLAGDFDIETDLLREILQYFEKVKLITVNNGFLFSKRLKERFSTLITKREQYRNRVFDVENPQSKVNKSIVDKSRVNIIEESIIRDTRAPIDFNSIYNTQGFENIERMMAHEINIEQINSFWETFKTELIAKDDLFRTKEDYRRHFPSWVKIQVEKQGSSIMKPKGILTD